MNAHLVRVLQALAPEAVHLSPSLIPACHPDEVADGAALPFRNDSRLLAVCGRFQAGEGALLLPMAPSRCHENAARLFQARCDADHVQRVTLHTGYALVRGDGWRRHSWCVQADGAVLETTVPRDAYFGVAVGAYPDDPVGWAFTDLQLS